MKKPLILIILLVVLCFSVPLAASADTGVGIILGDPTGLSLLLEERIALGLAWDLSNHLHVHGDVWLLNKALSDPVNWYLGLGAKLLVFNDNSGDAIGVGVRVPVGLQWYATPELELFAEIVPGMRLIPSTDFDIDFGIGLRYHF